MVKTADFLYVKYYIENRFIHPLIAIYIILKTFSHVYAIELGVRHLICKSSQALADQSAVFVCLARVNNLGSTHVTVLPKSELIARRHCD